MTTDDQRAEALLQQLGQLLVEIGSLHTSDPQQVVAYYRQGVPLVKQTLHAAAAAEIDRLRRTLAPFVGGPDKVDQAVNSG